MSRPMELAVSLYSVSDKTKPVGHCTEETRAPLLCSTSPPRVSMESAGRPIWYRYKQRCRPRIMPPRVTNDFTVIHYPKVLPIPPTGHEVPNLRSDEALRKSQPAPSD